MSVEIILIFIPLLLILSYVFELFSKFIKIPSVIFVLLLGFLFKILTINYGIVLNEKEIFLTAKILGTIGLILIILEAALEIEINKENLKILISAFVNAFLQLVFISLILSFIFYHIDNREYEYYRYLINAIPLAVISSAIAIPAVVNLDKRNKDFIVYESSFSDILGILFFNLLAYKNYVKFEIVWEFSFNILLMIILSLFFTLFLFFLIHYLDYHVKFIPIILSIVIFYALAKIVNLPSLILILIFGLFLSNIELLKNINFKGFELSKFFDFDLMDLETKRFRDIVIEFTFLIRTLFFLIFGFMLNLDDIVNLQNFLLSLFIISIILIIRYFFLRLTKQQLLPLVLISPRGLITIILFLSITQNKVELVNISLVVQVILLSVLIMALGVGFNFNNFNKISNEENKNNYVKKGEFFDK